MEMVERLVFGKLAWDFPLLEIKFTLLQGALTPQHNNSIAQYFLVTEKEQPTVMSPLVGVFP
jgi:hypothetical protein